MAVEAYRYRFKEHIDPLDAAGSLHLAIIAAEAQVQMDAGYAVDGSIRVIVVDASTAVGQDVNAMFTHFLLMQHGPEAFNVRRVEGRPCSDCREDGR